MRKLELDLKLVALPLVIFVLSLAVLATTARAAGGSGPSDALLPVGVTQTVAAHSAQWYRFYYSGDKSPIRATVDANGASGVRLDIYTPEAIANWQNGEALTAIGIGSPMEGHDLGWVGRFNFAGTFYAVVYNDSAVNVAISVRVTGDAVTTSVNVTAAPTARPNPFATKTPLGKGVKGKLAFVDAPGGNLYTVNGDGTNLQRVSFGIDPQWSHSGAQIALAREGPVAGIFTINADGSNERLLYEMNQVRAPDWNPDDARLAFSYLAKVKGGGELCFFGRCFTLPENALWRLGAVNVADGALSEVRSTNHSFTPTWHRDGATIAYLDPGIGMMQTSSSGDVEPFPFIGDLRLTMPTYSPLKLMSPQYSPDGRSIVYMVLQSPAWQIAVASADGSNQRLLTKLDPLDFAHPHNVAPVWSPDGSQILFLSDRNGKWEFFVMNVGDPRQGADGANQRQVLKSITDQIAIRYEFMSERMVSWSR